MEFLAVLSVIAIVLILKISYNCKDLEKISKDFQRADRCFKIKKRKCERKLNGN